MRRWRSRPPRLSSARRLAIAAVALLVIGVVVSSLPQVPVGVHRGRRTSVALTARPGATGHAPRGASPVSAPGLARARAAARSFADSFLAVVDGRAPASSVTGATPALRQELARAGAWVTPAERERHPRVVSVEAFGEAPGFVLATAWVSDGGIATYPLRLVVQQERRGWLVNDVVGG
jgi:hypothetical protein